VKLDRELMLDAEALSALLDERKEGHSDAQAVLAALASEAPDGTALFIVPSIALYEVRRGLLKVAAKRRLRDLDRFIRGYADISDFDEIAANSAAEVWAARARAGRPPGERDVLILGCAVAEDADIVTRDAGFPTVEGVVVRTWKDLAALLPSK
jgi:predicted nucleic acid-binding protein